MEINIAHFYPELLNLYGDKGNIAALRARCEWRGIKADVIEISLGDDMDFSDIDIALLGGGTDKDQLLVCSSLKKIKENIKSYIDADGVMLVLCGSFPMLGNSFVLNGEAVEGLGILNVDSQRTDKRLISNIVLNTSSGTVVGFENHADRVSINGSEAFGEVLYGYGNSEEAGCEGVCFKNLLATFLHGPLLPKNPALTDSIILKALRRKYGASVSLAPLDDTAELNASSYIINRFIKD